MGFGKMMTVLSLVSFPLYLVMLAEGINILISFLCALFAMVVAASIINKIYFGKWNPF